MRPGRTAVAGMLGRGRARALHQWIQVAAHSHSHPGYLPSAPRIVAAHDNSSSGHGVLGGLPRGWLGMVMRAMWTARRRGQPDWAGLFLSIGCYAIAIVINTTFDTTLEGPMQDVWFWCLLGFGIGSVMVYRAQLHERV